MRMGRPLYKNILLISGTGREVGKTTLACMLLEKFRRRVTALKISPHQHEIDDNADFIVRKKNFIILNETNLNGSKDSSRFLQSGAGKSIYVQADENHIFTAFNYLMKNHNGEAMICESAALGRFIKPAVHLRVTNASEIVKKEGIDIPFDKLVINRDNNFRIIIEQVDLTNSEWILKND